MPKRLVIVAALEREVRPLVRGWASTALPTSRGLVKLLNKGNVLVAVSGIGTPPARAAADAAYRHVSGDVHTFVSAGLAGALTSDWKVADIFEPAIVIDDADGIAISAGSGAGTLITASTIADQAVKQMLAARHVAQAVDMEAYAVADVARIYGVPFRAVKAISDELDFPLPPLGKFIGADGRFRTGGFALYAAARPGMWPAVLKLGANAGKASQVLCRELASLIERFERSDRYNRVTTKP